MKTNRIFILCSFFFIALQYGSAQLDSLKNIGHASMKIKTSDGKVIYIDPYATGDYADSADILLVTHSHGDHNNQSLVKKKPTCTVITYATAIQGGVYQSYTIGGIKIDAVAAYNTSNSNHVKSSCVGYVVEFNGIKLYHAGDTENIPEMAELAARNLDYALLPMESVFTMTPEKATLAAGDIKAKQFIPMHTMTSANDTVDDNAIARFTVPNKIILKKGKSIALQSNPVSVNGSSVKPPLSFMLEQNYPNPFNPSTTIRFTIPASGFSSLKVFNQLGKETTTLVHKELSSGSHSFHWNAENFPNGIYFYRLNSGTRSETKKMLLLK